MTTQETDLGEMLWDMIKGSIHLGGIHMDWDFTDGLTKEQWIRRRQIENGDMIILKNGRIIFPRCNIY